MNLELCDCVWNLTLCLLRMVQFFHSRSLTCCPDPMPSLFHPLRGQHQPGNLYSAGNYTFKTTSPHLSAPFTKLKDTSQQRILLCNSRRHEGQRWLRDASLTSQESSQEWQKMSRQNIPPHGVGAVCSPVLRAQLESGPCE